MDSSKRLFYSVGFLLVALLVASNLSPSQARLSLFEDVDHRTRIKRNAVLDSGNDTVKENTTGAGSGSDKPPANQTVPPPEPTVCITNSSDSADNVSVTVTCPQPGQSRNMNKCCGPKLEQYCCVTAATDDNDDDNDDPMKIDQMDVVTGIGIAVGFVLSISVCMFLYCCCCQRRPEIHDGIKLMWVRRSFGKELNRLEQPTYPNHLAVVSSRANSRFTSRQGSRQGSRAGSRQGSLKGASRNPSVNPSPSISRRASHDQHRSSLKASHTPSPRPSLKVELPSAVVITVTTPSDEHGPTQPLLKAVESTDLQEI